MKKGILSLLITYLFILTSTTQALSWEIGIIVLSQNTQTLHVYSYDTASRTYKQEGYGLCTGNYDKKDVNGTLQTVNAALDYNGGPNTIGKDLTPGETYFLVIGNWWMSISGSNQDIWFSYTDEGGFSYVDKNPSAVYTYSIGDQDWNSKTINLANNFGNDGNSCFGMIQMNNAIYSHVGLRIRR